jgi:hypothetical protein
VGGVRCEDLVIGDEMASRARHDGSQPRQELESRRSFIAASSNGLPSPPSPRPANAFRASSSTIPDNWPSCTLSYALHRSHPPTLSPAKSIRTSSPPSVAPRSNTAWPPFDTTSPSCAPKAWSGVGPPPPPQERGYDRGWREHCEHLRDSIGFAKCTTSESSAGAVEN